MKISLTCRLALAVLGIGLGFAGQMRADVAPGPVTFHEHVAPLLFQHCASCHRPGQSAPFSLLSFADARKRAPELAKVTARHFMPPWLPAPGHGDFLGERRLSEVEIATFARWRDAGAPEGDPRKSPPTPTWATDWQLGAPDLIVKMPIAYTVPASGRDVYRHFILPLALAQRRYVRAWEFRPHSRSVHHAFLRTDRTGEARRRDALDPEPGFPGMDTPVGVEAPSGHFASWQPGAPPRQNPPGLPWVIESGSDLVLQMHLQPLGKTNALQAEIGFYFTDQPPTNQPVKVSLINYGIDLPAGSTQLSVTDELVIPADVDLLGVLPHTHYLGRRIEAWATLPDATRQTLLEISDWDFNWQGDYIYRHPIFLPAGTRLGMRIQFDNSTNNPHNPSSPPRRVQFGLNTTDEMAEVWFQLLPRSAAGSARLSQVNLERTARDTLAFNEQRLRINPNDGPALVNLGRALLAQKRNDEARRRFEQAVQLDPRLDEAHYYLGILHRLRGALDDAEREFGLAIQANPQHARAHGNLGMVHYGLGRYEEAAEHFNEAIRLNGTDSLAHGALGAIRLIQGRNGEAVQLLSRAVQLDPANVDVRKNLELARRRMANRP